MTVHVRTASTLAVVALLWAAPASIASAQDAMELDLAFKNSVPQAHAPVAGEVGRKVEGRNDKARNAQGLLAVEKRRARR
jgi:hypothetical protein